MIHPGPSNWLPGAIIAGMCTFFLAWSIDVVFRRRDKRVLYFTGSSAIFLVLTIVALKDIL